MVEKGVVVICTYQSTGKYHSVEGNVIFRHKLIEFNLHVHTP